MIHLRRCVCLLPLMLGVLFAGCQKHPLEDEISLEDAAKMLIDESTLGKSIYGGEPVASDTITTELAGPPATTLQWTAQWDFLGHNYSITYDTVIDRNVWLRGAMMSFLDSMKITLDVLIAADSAIHKTKYATCHTSALLVQLGTYGSPYNGWVLRKIRHRRFLGPTMMLANVTVQCGDNSWPLADAEFSIDSVARFSPGDSVTVRAKTADPSHLLFLNVADGGAIHRIPMIYSALHNEFVAGWRVSPSAISGRFYQATVEAYTRTSVASPVPTDVGVSGQTFVYKIT